MTPEERLDRLIELREQGERRFAVRSDDLAARMAAADAIAQLQAIDAPPTFAAHLESRIRARVRQNGQGLPVPRPPEQLYSHRIRLRRSWMMVLGIAAALILLCVGTFTAAARSLPGDLLYGLKQFEHQFALNFASDQHDRAELEISQLRTGLADLNAVINERRGDDAILQAIDAVAAETRASQAAVAALPVGTERTVAQGDLARALAEEEQTLRHALGGVDWPLRLAVTQQLGVLGDAVPTVTQVTVGHPSNGTVSITLTGTNFAPGAALAINGVPKGTVSKTTATTLVALLTASEWPKGNIAVGVLNPDGTAAQITLKAGDDENEPDSDDQQHQGTPGPTSTPDGDDGGRPGQGSPTPIGTSPDH